MKGLTAACLLILSLLTALPSFAGAWRPVLHSHEQGPELLVAVDKARQQLFMLSRRSPLKLLKSLPCTTGQSNGDKLVQGDLRTPEGVYFIQSRLRGGLDWELYGDVAYPLNYPNPVDRIRGKTGSGIWLHGRGKQLVPRDTRGCVALADPDIDGLENDLATGTPVVIADELNWTDTPGEDQLLARKLVSSVQQWAKDWSRRSDDFFAHYDPEGMTRSGVDFQWFQNRKQRIFSSHPWIDVMVENVHALPGPGYWVTWFDQLYRTGSLTSAVGKRLYWLQDDDGNWRIAGREITDAAPDLQKTYLEHRAQTLAPLVRSWADAWETGDLDTYAGFYDPHAVQGSRRGADHIRDYKAQLWEEKRPLRVGLQDLDFRLHSGGIAATFIQTYEDATGYEDKGRKTLVFTPTGQGWRIVSEQWSAL
ncbi:Murein L,D-transpeptidase YafK [Paucidesulfovibrio gracilis DSM 16080]|uniref:Murein L,D-transpeptidase YafK n=1 Tax=Paucidesulfovibrio gracilis DSM 16080 TaxID=1121449 RepID=A0A1T4X229_9BACT|nr:L,D-transpeptidase family protein [Paucidesulfovibrio gracilis]SKA83632.1 Murein L,D-transpeptidase YafK [Paucidesulfovibrio gracilis DSM 16080]